MIDVEAIVLLNDLINKLQSCRAQPSQLNSLPTAALLARAQAYTANALAEKSYSVDVIPDWVKIYPCEACGLDVFWSNTNPGTAIQTALSPFAHEGEGGVHFVRVLFQSGNVVSNTTSVGYNFLIHDSICNKPRPTGEGPEYDFMRDVWDQTYGEDLKKKDAALVNLRRVDHELG